MILSFTMLGENDGFVTYSCQIVDFEAALDVLTVVVLEGHTLMNACLIDEGSRMELPVEAFDGYPVAVPVRRLEKQWQSALRKPLRS